MGQAAPRHAPVCRGVEAPLDLCGCICPLLSPQPGGWGQGGRGPGPATQGTSQPGSVTGLQTKGRLLFCP